ncbi:MAG: hypothetical protein MUC50_02355, partial [Myxococcota bacterium]|nr:hypothetical protein [Myxococcota bacterium]
MTSTPGLRKPGAAFRRAFGARESVPDLAIALPLTARLLPRPGLELHLVEREIREVDDQQGGEEP